MKWKSMFILIVLNIFVMLLVTVTAEYVNLADRFVTIEDTVQEALDSAITTSTRSEEFFTEKVQAEMQSYGITSNKTTSYAETTLWLRGSQQFLTGNTYVLARYYEEYGSFPSTLGEYQTFNNQFTDPVFGQAGAVYKWLYGNIKSDYTNSGLTYWANRSTSRIKEYNSFSTSGSRDAITHDVIGETNASNNFKTFYQSIGKYQQTVGYLKHRVDGSNQYKLGLETYPVLANMGFEYMQEYNKVSSDVTSDNFTSTYHVGKATNSQKKTVYFLTPTSLGVTYIPTEVLKPTFLANLDTLVRLRMLGSDPTTTSTDDIKTTMQQANSCIQTNVFNNGTQAVHTKSSTAETIVSDGDVEFDLSTAQVKVDYFYINFGDTSLRTRTETIVSKINGAVQVYDGAGVATLNESDSRKQTLNSFINQDNDTSRLVQNFGGQSLKEKYENVRNGRIVARVSVKIKCHVPYKSAILQWMAQKTGTNHFDIKSYDPEHLEADDSSDGLWFKYTTYYCTSRT